MLLLFAFVSMGLMYTTLSAYPPCDGYSVSTTGPMESGVCQWQGGPMYITYSQGSSSYFYYLVGACPGPGVSTCLPKDALFVDMSGDGYTSSSPCVTSNQWQLPAGNYTLEVQNLDSNNGNTSCSPSMYVELSTSPPGGGGSQTGATTTASSGGGGPQTITTIPMAPTTSAPPAKQCSITGVISGKGSMSLIGGSKSALTSTSTTIVVACGTTVSLAVSPDMQWSFENWTCSGGSGCYSGQSTDISVPVTSNITETANFKESTVSQCTLAGRVNGGGSIALTGTSSTGNSLYYLTTNQTIITVPCGSQVQIAAAPWSGYEFSGWTCVLGNCYTGQENRTSFSLDGNDTEIAAFTNIQTTVVTTISSQTNSSGVFGAIGNFFQGIINFFKSL